MLPFSLTKALARVTILMKKILKQYVHKLVAVFLVDILVCSKTLQQDSQHVGLVLQNLGVEKLCANLSECTLGADFVKCLGYHLASNGANADPKMVNVTREWPAPKTKNKIQSILGFFNYYGRFIRSCFEIAKPLTVFTSKISFKWKTGHTTTLKTMQKAICFALVLKLFDPRLPTFITTSASKYTIGAFTEQLEVKQTHSVSLLFRTLNEVNRSCLAHEKKLPAIVYTVCLWRPYLHEKSFVVYSAFYPLR